MLIIFGCTKSDDDKAAKLVKEWLEKNVNDPSSLEIVSITPVKTDSVLSYEDDIDYEMKKDGVLIFEGDTESCFLTTDGKPVILGEQKCPGLYHVLKDLAENK